METARELSMQETATQAVRLNVRDEAGTTRQIPLEEQQSFSIGRDPACEVVLLDINVSRRHARLVRGDEHFFVEDLESLNGVWVNGNRISGPTSIGLGDRIEIGDYLLWIDDDSQTRRYFSAPTIRLDAKQR